MKTFNTDELIKMFSKENRWLSNQNPDHKTIYKTLLIVKERYPKYINSLVNLVNQTFKFEEEKQYEVDYDWGRPYDSVRYEYYITCINDESYKKLMDICKQIKLFEEARITKSKKFVKDIELNKNSTKEDVFYILNHLDTKYQPFTYNIYSIYNYFKKYNNEKLNSLSKLVKKYTKLHKSNYSDIYGNTYVKSYTLEPKNDVVRDYVIACAKKIRVLENTNKDNDFNSIVNELNM